MNDNEYDQIARRFFNEFLDMKIALNKGEMTKPKDYDKELAAYKKANEKLRGAAADLADENKKLEEALALADERERDLRRQLNEAVVNLGRLQEKVAGLGLARQKLDAEGYPFREHMSEESRKLFDQLMREVPRPGHD